jgi:hypothetical protein
MRLGSKVQTFDPSIITQNFRSTRNQLGNNSPIFALVLLYCIRQRAVFICCPFSRTCARLVALGVQSIVPSMRTLCFCSTRNQLGNSSPTFVLVPHNCIRQRAVFFCCPYTQTCGRIVALGVQHIVPPILTVYFRSTRNQLGNSSPIFALVLLYCIHQRTVFICCPFTRTCGRLVVLGVQGIVLSSSTLYFRSTRNQRGNYSPIFALVPHNCILQRAVFFCRPFTRTCGRHVALGVQGIVPSVLHCIFVRPETSSEIAAQSSPLFFSTASVSVLSSSVVDLPARVVVSSLLECRALGHLVLHCIFVRPGTSAAIAARSSSLCFSTASVSVLSSSVVHLPARAVVSSLLESKALCHCHLFLRCVFDPPGNRAATAAQSVL